MGGEWQDTTLGEFLTLQRGFDLPKKKRVDGPYPVIASTGPVGKHIDAAVKGPGVVIGRSGSLGGGQYIQSDFWPLNTTLWVKDFKGNDRRFCYYLLKSMDFTRYNAGSGVPTLNRNHIHPLPVHVPPLPEQRAIACILGALDDKIELNRRMNETLEAMARAIFKSWFVDFLPVRAKQRARTQTGDPVRAKADLPAASRVAAQAGGRQLPGLAPHIADLFPDAFEESELGEIPRGWNVRPIGDVVKVLGGGTPSTKEPTYWEGGVHPFCTPKDMSSLPSPVLLGTERHLTDDGLAKVSSGQLPKGTVLLSSRAPIGYLAVAETPVSVNQGIIAMVCDGELPNLYVLQWAYANMERIIANANGSTFLEISKRNFRPIEALVPPELVLEQFMRLAGPLHQRLVSNLRQVLYLAAIRDTLLPRLISGELRVPDAERIVGRCV